MMHQELSKREKISMAKLGLTILLAATLLILINTLLVKFQLNSSLTDLIILGSTAILTYLFMKQNMISYKYSLIDDELIIHEVLGSKEKRILNMNLNQIMRFAHVKEDTFITDKQMDVVSRKKLYNCVNIQKRHYILYEEGTIKKWVTIQPSDCMINLINDRLNQ